MNDDPALHVHQKPKYSWCYVHQMHCNVWKNNNLHKLQHKKSSLISYFWCFKLQMLGRDGAAAEICDRISSDSEDKHDTLSLGLS